MKPSLYYNLVVPRSKKRRIWKKWGISKGGRYGMSYYLKTESGTAYKVSYDLTLKAPRRGRILKILLITNSHLSFPYCISQISCVPKEGV